MPTGVRLPLSHGCQLVLAALDQSFIAALQTVGGTPAKSFTKDEFCKLFKDIKAKVDAALKKNPGLFKVQPHYQFDMASWHRVPPEQLGIKKSQLIVSPPVGAELQKPVEHQIGGSKRRFKRRYNDDRSLKEGTAATVQAFREEAAKAKKTKISKDVKSLKKTYKQVIERKGGYAGREAR